MTDRSRCLASDEPREVGSTDPASRFLLEDALQPARSNGKHPGGRPSKYDPTYPTLLLRYFLKGGRVIYKPFVVSDGNNSGSHVENHRIGRLPAMFEGFATKIRVTGSTLLQWRDTYPEFSAAYEKAKDIQRQHLVEGVTGGVYNPAGAIFFLKNCHGFRDRFPDESKPAEVNVTVNLSFVDSLKKAGQEVNRLATLLTTTPHGTNGHA